MEVTPKLDIKKIRSEFPILNQKVWNKPFIYLDNASTTLKPTKVINKVQEYYSQYSANVHRAIYAFGEKATLQYENTRTLVKELINAKSEKNIIFTKGTTESINLVAYSWGRKFLKPGDEILISEMEHHSNNVPWQMCAKDTGAIIKYIPITANGELDLTEPDRYFTPKTKLLCLIHQSNVFGTINPIKQIIDYAKNVGAVTLIDAAQSIPHTTIDVQDLGCDFLAFSGHKMIGPTGVGILYGKKELLDSMNPFLGGGEMIKEVSLNKVSFTDSPGKFEAGTPNIAQVIGFGEAINYLNVIGFDIIDEYVKELTEYTIDSLSSINDLIVYGKTSFRNSVVSFNLSEVHPHDLAQSLDQEGIAIRAGHHCAQPIMTKLEVSSTARVSLYIYNTKSEIDLLVNALDKTIQFF